MPDPFATLTYDTTIYPYSTGLAQLSDVTSRVNAGSWDPNKPTAYPTAAMVNNWLMEGTAQIDAALAVRGYYVPLQANAGWTPPTGMTTWRGIGLQAWQLLRSMCAAFAVHSVEQSRHGAVGQAAEDTNATSWLGTFNAFLTDLRNAQDNLTAFGVGGAFTPDIDPAQALRSGSIGAFLSDPARTNGPLFSKTMRLGSGIPPEEGSGLPGGWQNQGVSGVE